MHRPHYTVINYQIKFLKTFININHTNQPQKISIIEFFISNRLDFAHWHSFGGKLPITRIIHKLHNKMTILISAYLVFCCGSTSEAWWRLSIQSYHHPGLQEEKRAERENSSDQLHHHPNPSKSPPMRTQTTHQMIQRSNTSQDNPDLSPPTPQASPKKTSHSRRPVSWKTWNKYLLIRTILVHIFIFWIVYLSINLVWIHSN